MLPPILFKKAPANSSSVRVFSTLDRLPSHLNANEADWVTAQLQQESWAVLNRYTHQEYFVQVEEHKEAYQTYEKLRKIGHKVYASLSSHKASALELSGDISGLPYFLEGLLLSSYTFNKYKTDKGKLDPLTIYLSESNQDGLATIISATEGTMIARTLVNEPVIYLTANQLSEEIKSLGAQAGFTVEVLEEAKIQSLKMGGLLAVNAGSVEPPTFNILEYKGQGAKPGKPIVLVGKGVVYDTGGLSLKPTSDSMDMMKSDMGGAAAVIGAFYAIAKSKLPVHIVGLIPATDNRPGENAITPGDVITQYDGTTVEVLNTDAEGRLILADALAYAKKYKPALVIDLATLTGAAARAIGPEGIVYMGSADKATKDMLEQAGQQTYERLVEFPLWVEYKSQIESKIADLKNLGGPNAGAITAGLFLQHFTNYPWLHLDIAGPAYLTKPDSYRLQGGSGVGVRLIYNFVKEYVAI